MNARARLPDNLIDAKKRAERELVLELHRQGVLFRLHKYIAERLNDFQVEMNHTGSFVLGGEPASDNQLWCLLRRDIEAQGFEIPSHVMRKVVDISFAYIRMHMPPLAQGETAFIVSTHGE